MSELEDVASIKQKLRQYELKDLEFNEPHFSQQLLLREGNKTMVIRHLLDPVCLVSVRKELGKYSDNKFALHFSVSSSLTMIIPVIFDKSAKKSLYILTYIMRYRRTP